jgi:hypothetical protein
MYDSAVTVFVATNTTAKLIVPPSSARRYTLLSGPQLCFLSTNPTYDSNTAFSGALTFDTDDIIAFLFYIAVDFSYEVRVGESVFLYTSSGGQYLIGFSTVS